jgi:protein-S-isoprenylcysteine O-methyltransferase Ste14
MGIFWLVFYIFVWGVVHSILASLQFKAFIGRTLGPALGRAYRLAFNAFAVISFLPVLIIAALAPGRRLYAVPLPWSGLMVLGELLAAVALLVGIMQTGALEFIGLEQLAGSGEKRQAKLVTNGLYRYVRHPLYSAGMVFIWLVPLMTVNLLAINIAASLYLIIGAAFEERKLQRQYGQAYAEYKAITPMFIPFVK